jgi:hypothetical protein
MVNTTGLTDEERALYEQVQAEINAMILLEEEKERTKAEWQKTMIYGYHSDRRAYQLQGLPFDFSSPRDNIEERSIRVSLQPLHPTGLQAKPIRRRNYAAAEKRAQRYGWKFEFDFSEFGLV